MRRTDYIFILILLMNLALTPVAKAETGEVLFGAAAITAAVSAMVVPGIQAQSQVNIAKTNAQTSTAISQMNAQTALFQAQLQSQMAQANAFSSAQIARYNQQTQTKDLLSQLQFLAYNRALDTEMSKLRMAQEIEMQNNLMALEMKKMELNQVLTEAQNLAGIGSLAALKTPNISTQLPPLAASLEANAQLPPALQGAQSSTGLKRALSSSVSSGSTRMIRRGLNRDLTNLINATALADASIGETSSRRLQRSSTARAAFSHHRR